jgi:hypothetical protein
LDKYEENMAKAYIIIFHQCTNTHGSKIKKTNTFPTFCTNLDPIALMKLIQRLFRSYDLRIQSVMATVASYKQLFIYNEKDGVNDHTYH